MTILAFMDGEVVNVALPTFQARFYATSSEVQWVVQSYALFCAALLLFGGTLGDRWTEENLCNRHRSLYSGVRRRDRIDDTV
jgi:MFS family permease